MSGPVVLRVWTFLYFNWEDTRDDPDIGDLPPRQAWSTMEQAKASAEREWRDMNDGETFEPLVWQEETNDFVATIGNQECPAYFRVYAIEVVS